MYSGYLDSYEEAKGVYDPHKDVPAVYRCITLSCSDYLNEYLVNHADAKGCPTCKKEGTWVRKFIGHKSEVYSCGMCKKVVILGTGEYVVGHYGWGFIQLSKT